MISRAEFLRKKIPNKENIYEGGLLIAKNMLFRYEAFRNSFKPMTESKKIVRTLTRKDLVIVSGTLYVFYVKDLGREKINFLKYQIVQNFVANWTKPSEYNYAIDPLETQFSHLTISHITADEIYERAFTRTLIPDEEFYSDIQFISMPFRERSYMKYYYHEVIQAHIGIRGNRGLVTIILFSGYTNEFEKLKYDDRLNSIVNIKEVDIQNVKEGNSDTADIPSQIDNEVKPIDNIQQMRPNSDTRSLDALISMYR